MITINSFYRLKLQLENNELVSETLKWIADGPSHYVMKYHGYVINGSLYNTKERDDYELPKIVELIL